MTIVSRSCKPIWPHIVVGPKINKHISLLFDANPNSDKEFDLLNYQWEVLAKPDGATVTMVNFGFVNTFAEFNLAGDYQFSLYYRL